MLILSTDWQMFIQRFMHNAVGIFTSEHHHIQIKCLSLQRQFSLNAHSLNQLRKWQQVFVNLQTFAKEFMQRRLS